MSIGKLLPTALTAALLGAGGIAVADDSDSGIAISGSVALTSDYRFRGISQSDESPAIQGGLDIEFYPGFYVGTDWADDTALLSISKSL